mmetsp:Transcript_54519/g.174855  ORF Transcript_54519/g.174855 Transcript_54519/m.174855 type:complete len:235 (-) Transcript_54519:71-775(-)
MQPKDTRISIGIGIRARISSRTLCRAMARMMKGIQMVAISCTGISSMSVSFIAWSRETSPVVETSKPSGPWKRLISSIISASLLMKASAFSFLSGDMRHIHCRRMARWSLESIGFSPSSWWWSWKVKKELTCTMVPGLSLPKRFTRSVICCTKPRLRSVAALTHGTLHLNMTISRRMMARSWKWCSKTFMASVLSVPGGGFLTMGAAFSTSSQAKGAMKTARAGQATTKMNLRL